MKVLAASEASFSKIEHPGLVWDFENLNEPFPKASGYTCPQNSCPTVSHTATFPTTIHTSSPAALLTKNELFMLLSARSHVTTSLANSNSSSIWCNHLLEHSRTLLLMQYPVRTCQNTSPNWSHDHNVDVIYLHYCLPLEIGMTTFHIPLFSGLLIL